MDYILFNTVTKETSLHNNFQIPRSQIRVSENPLDWVLYPIDEDLYDGELLFILDANVEFNYGTEQIVAHANSGWGVVGFVARTTNIGYFIENYDWIDDEEIELMKIRDEKGLDLFDDSEDYEEENDSQNYFLTDIENGRTN